MQKLLKYLLVLAAIGLLSNCSVKYSFTGSSIPADVKTISFHYLKNNAPLVKASLSQQLTDAIRQRFVSQTNLTEVSKGGDWDISGEITGYSTNPIAIQGDQTAAMNRLTVTINIRFVDKKDEKKNFETSFSRYSDYPSSKPLAAVESTILDEIVDYLVDDVFNKIAVNW